MKMLYDEGYDLTVGVLNVLDSDHEAATSLDISVVEEAPFSRITEEAHRRNIELILSSDVVIVANTFFGEGNMLNLKAAKEALNHRIPLILLESTPFSQRNFGGKESEDVYET